MDFYSLFRKAAFKCDAENVHNSSLALLAKAPWLSKLFTPLNPDAKYSLTHNGIHWSFPVGVAAGFDKNAECINFFKNIGFGSLEVGTVTKLAQSGNPRPRIFRHPEIKSLQNSMGFPSAGAERVLQNIKKNKTKNFCLGVNLGKNKETQGDQVAEEYAELYETFAPVSDYLVINISSPNTPGLRAFQKKEQLSPILEAIDEKRKITSKPIFIKISPDLAREDVTMVCELSKEMNFSGIIATNTTTQHNFGIGGLSGQYAKEVSQKMRTTVCDVLREDPTQTLIGVGGIDSYQEVLDFWKQGGHFAQVYTGFIYQGPKLLHSIQKGIQADLQKYQFGSLQEMHQNISQLA